MIKMFTNPFPKLNLNKCSLVCSGKFSGQTEVGLNDLIFGIASNLDEMREHTPSVNDKVVTIGQLEITHVSSF